MNHRRAIGIALAIGIAGIVLVAPTELRDFGAYGARPSRAAAVAVLMAILWLTEAIPIAWTACLPLALYPCMGVFGGAPAEELQRSISAFGDGYLLLFLGGMVLGAAMEQWNLHRRVALHVLRAIGAEPRRLLMGILVATASVSMWISNTATAVMMVPIAMALRARLEEDAGRKLPAMGCALALAVAYAANVGGIGTKIGTGTNSIFVGFLADRLQMDLGFLPYMGVGIPFVALFLPVVWAALWGVARADAAGLHPADEVVAREIATMGPWSPRERQVAVVFAAAALLWVFGDPLRGWLAPSGFKSKHWEATVSMVAAGSLVSTGAVSPAALRGLPWSTLLLLGGSFAMAAGIEGSGLSAWLTAQLVGLSEWSQLAQIGLAATATVGLSAVASNTASINVLLNVLPPSLPVLAASALGASCDFMLPAGTPPNAIVFGSGSVRLPTMIRVGFALDVAAIVAITVYSWLWVGPFLGA